MPLHLDSSSFRAMDQVNKTKIPHLRDYQSDCYTTPPHFRLVSYRHCEQLAARLMRLDPDDILKLFSEDALLADIELPAT